MFSKAGLFSLIALSLLTAACSMNVGEKPPAPAPLSVPGSEDLKCLSRTKPTLRGFFNGTASVTEVDSLWNCFGTALITFQKSVRGQAAQVYTDQELARFIELYFLDEKEPISDALLREFMRLKVLFVGGDIQSVTKKELQSVISVLDELRVISQQIRVYMPLLTLEPMNAKEAYDKKNAKLEASETVVREASQALGAILARHQVRYDFAHLLTFATEIEKLYEGKWSFSKKLQLYFPALAELKISFSGGSIHGVQGAEWNKFLLLLGSTYSQYMRFHYLWAEVRAEQREVTFLSDMVVRSLTVFADLISSKPQQKITKQEIARIGATAARIWPDFVLTDTMISGLMQVKMLFLGGTEQEWTLDEFNRSQAKVKAISKMAESLRPYISVYNLSWQPSGNEAQDRVHFNKAIEQLKVNLTFFGSIIETPYDIRNAEILVQEFADKYRDGFLSPRGAEKIVKQILPLVRYFKALLTHNVSTVIHMPEWQPMLQMSGVAAGIFYDAHYFKNENKKYGEYVDTVLTQLTANYEKSGLAGLRRSDLLPLIQKVNELELGFTITPEHLQMIFEGKRFLLGGNAEILSLVEMKQARSQGTFKKIFAIFEDLKPYMSVYSLSWKLGQDPKSNRAQYDLAIDKLKNNLSAFASLLRHPYDLQNSQILVRELVKRLRAGSSQAKVDQLTQQILSVVKQFKGVVAHDSGPVVSVAHWQPLLATSGVLADVFYDIHYFAEGAKKYPSYFDSILAQVTENYEKSRLAGIRRADLLPLIKTINEMELGVQIKNDQVQVVYEAKRLLIGGDLETITVSELKELRRQIPEWKKLYDEVYPSIALLLEGDKKLTREQYQQTARSFEKGFADLSVLLPKGIDLQQLKDLLIRSGLVEADMLEKNWMLVMEVRTLLTGDSSNFIDAKKIRALGPLVRKAMNFWADFKEIKMPESWATLAGLQALNQFLQIASPVVEDVLSHQPDKSLTEARLMSLVGTLRQQDWFRLDVSDEFVKKALQIVVGRLLATPEERFKKMALGSFGIEHWLRLKVEVKETLDVQSILDKVYGEGERRRATVSRRELLGQIQQSLNQKAGPTVELERMKKALAVPFGGNEDGHVYVNSPEAENYRVGDVFRSNLLRLGLKILIRSYASDEKRATQIVGLTEAEVKTGINDAKVFFPLLNFSYPMDDRFIGKRFLEATLFTPRSAGREIITFEAGFDYLTMILSGIGLTSAYNQHFAQVCAKQSSGAQDIKYDSGCVAQEIYRVVPQKLTSMPKLVEYFEAGGEKVYYALYLNLLRAADIGWEAPYISETDLAQLPQLLQYIEVTMQRFDTSKDGFISTSEALRAFPVYKSLLQKASGFEDEKWLRAVFTYMLKKGEVPEQNLSGGFELLLWQQKGEKNWNVRADRSMLVRILGTIAETLAKKNGPAEKALGIPLPDEAHQSNL